MIQVFYKAVQLYTVGHKNVPLYFGPPRYLVGFNFYTSWPMEIGMNALQRRHKIYNFTLTVSPHYLIKLKPHKIAYFEVNRHSILLLNSKNESMSYASCFYKLCSKCPPFAQTHSHVFDRNFIFKTQHALFKLKWTFTTCDITQLWHHQPIMNKKALLLQGNRAMPQLFFSV